MQREAAAEGSGNPAAAAARQPLIARLLSRNVATMLVRNTVVSCFVFAFDLALLWALVRYGGVGKLLAATLGFVAANSLHYALGRSWIFRGTERGVAAGYVYFLINATVGLTLTIVLYAAFLRFTSIDYLAARVIVSVIAGLAVFLLNAIFNFRRV